MTTKPEETPSEKPEETPSECITRLTAELADAERRVTLALSPDAKLLVAAKDKQIYALEQTVARHERANGRLVAELQEARESLSSVESERDAARGHLRTVLEQRNKYYDQLERYKADVLRLEALVESRGLNAAPGTDNSDAVTYEQCIEHMRRGGVIEAVDGSRLQRRKKRDAIGDIHERRFAGGEWHTIGPDGVAKSPGHYRLLPFGEGV